MTTKTYTRRDSATAVLRKLGVAPADYARFIAQADGQYHLDLAAAQASLAKPAKAKPAKAKPAKAKTAKAKTAKAKAAEGSATTVAGRCRELIQQGQTNKDIFAQLQQEFGLDDSKRHYPGWYRCQMRRQGAEA